MRTPNIFACVYALFMSSALLAQSPGNVESNLQLWLKADAGTSSSIDGDMVSYWDDQSMNGFQATDANMSPPTFKKDGQNFNPSLSFDGIDNGLNLGSNYMFSNNNGLTIFAVVKPDSCSGMKARQFVVDFGSFSGDGYGMLYGFPRAGMYTAKNWGGANNNRSVIHGRYDQPTLVTTDVEFDNQQEMRLDGELVLTRSITLKKTTQNEINEAPGATLDHGPFTIGRQSQDKNIASQMGRLFKGDISEVIVYDVHLDAIDRMKVESYLAIKYGLSLDQTAPTSYYSSSGEIIWDAAVNNSMPHNIAGIGKDEISNLHQKKSTSSDHNSIITIWKGNASDEAAPIDIDEDQTFMMWSNDFNPTINQATLEMPIDIVERIDREWVVSEMNGADGQPTDIGEVSIKFDLSQLQGSWSSGLFADYANLRLMIAAQSDFSAGATLMEPTIVNLADQTVIFTVPGEDIEHGSFFSLGSTSTTSLPVELIYFEASNNGTSVDLTWATATEIDNDYFQVERSLDGNTWTAIGEVAGAGNSSEMLIYTYQDVYQLKGSVYYRLKQVDFDGDFEYSPIASVHSSTADDQIDITAYPNPVTDYFVISSSNIALETAEVSIFTMNGQEVEAEVSNIGSAAMVMPGIIPNGRYLVRIENETSVHHTAVVIQR